jgi:hypothetical protein
LFCFFIVQNFGFREDNISQALNQLYGGEHFARQYLPEIASIYVTSIRVLLSVGLPLSGIGIAGILASASLTTHTSGQPPRNLFKLLLIRGGSRLIQSLGAL